MSNGARLGLIALAIGVAVVAFVVLSPGDTDDKADDPATTAEQSVATTPTATAPSAPPAAADEIVVKGGKPEGGVQRVVVKKGDTVRLLVSSDADHEIHLHGYDIARDAGPGKPARYRFKADVEGVFEIEVEDTGEKIANLVVEPG
jgi:FtsP/CotA-like multicopper oxidase with cupredoxin domain